MSKYLDVLLLPGVLLLMAGALIRAVIRDKGRLGWPQAQAEVIEVREMVYTHNDFTTFGEYAVACRFRTRSQQEVSGWAEGLYQGARDWPGTVRTVWHDPAQPGVFTLRAPERPGRATITVLPALLVFLAAAAGVGFLLWKMG